MGCTSGLDPCYSGHCMNDCEFNFHTGARHWNNLDCRKVCHGARGNRQLEEQKVEEPKVEVAAEPAPVQDLPCSYSCPIYLKAMYRDGTATEDMSNWCTNELNLCGNGHCMSDCEFNLRGPQGKGWTGIDCKFLCNDARGNRQLEEQKVEEPKVEVA